MKKAWSVYESLPSNFVKSDRIQIIMGTVGLELEKDEFMMNLFNTEFAVIREGEISIVELWYKYNAKKLAKDRNIELTNELIFETKVKFPPPKNIDVRLSGTL